MKKIIFLGVLAMAISACTVLETKNKVILSDGTKVEVGVSVEQSSGSGVNVDG
jgi:hypothetical protein